MFRFRTNHQPPRERRDGFVSFRCFLWLEEEEGRGRERESGRTGRMGEDFERKKEDGEDGNGIQRENENQAF